MSSNIALIPFSKMIPGTEAISFVLLAGKEEARTKEGKPYFKVTFCDSLRTVTCPVWFDSPHFMDCRDNWKIGDFYKIQSIMRETSYGPKLDLKRIREVAALDKVDGFDPNLCRPSSRVSPEIILDEILELARLHLNKGPLLALIKKIFKDHQAKLMETAASGYHHHIYVGGLLEHILSVTKIAIFLVDHFRSYYPNEKGMISKPLIVAGAILHDIGKISEMCCTGLQHKHTIQGELLGHFVLGRDLIRDNAPLVKLDSQTQLLLEHIILSHSAMPEWGAPKAPMTLEAFIVSQADNTEAVFSTMIRMINTDDISKELTARKSPLGAVIYKAFLDDKSEGVAQ